MGSHQVQWCNALWMQQSLDALRDTLDVGADLKRDMIDFLFDVGMYSRETLSHAAAVSRFNDCLNPSKPQKFSLAEVWALMRQFERFQLLHVMAADCQHELRRIPTEARREQLLQTIATALDQVSTAQHELLRMGTAITPRIHPAIASGTGSFDKGGI